MNQAVCHLPFLVSFTIAIAITITITITITILSRIAKYIPR